MRREGLFLSSNLSERNAIINTTIVERKMSMKKIRIHFEDLSTIDFFATERQKGDFQGWLRFAGQDDVFALPGSGQKIRRREIVRIETVEK